MSRIVSIHCIYFCWSSLDIACCLGTGHGGSLFFPGYKKDPSKFASPTSFHRNPCSFGSARSAGCEGTLWARWKIPWTTSGYLCLPMSMHPFESWNRTWCTTHGRLWHVAPRSPCDPTWGLRSRSVLGHCDRRGFRNPAQDRWRTACAFDLLEGWWSGIQSLSLVSRGNLLPWRGSHWEYWTYGSHSWTRHALTTQWASQSSGVRLTITGWQYTGCRIGEGTIWMTGALTAQLNNHA